MDSGIKWRWRKKLVFSYEVAAQQVLISVCLCVRLSVVKLKFYLSQSSSRLSKATQGYPKLPKITQGYPGLPKVTQGYPRLPKVTHAVPWACMKLYELSCSSMNLHEVLWACMQSQGLECRVMILNAVLWACKQFHSRLLKVTYVWVTHVRAWVFMQFYEHAFNYMSMHAVLWAFMQFHELTCSSMSLLAVPWSMSLYAGFICLSEQLTITLQCLLLVYYKLGKLYFPTGYLAIF